MTDTKPQNWDEASSTLYRQLAAVAVPRRAEQMATLLALLPFGRGESFRVVELASGEGLLAKALLTAFPKAQLTALDGSESMRATTHKTLFDFSGRYTVAPFDILADGWFGHLDGADCVLSSLCVHHLDGAGKQVLFRQVAERLTERGVLLLADLIAANHPGHHILLAESWDAAALTEADQLHAPAAYEAFLAERWNIYRFPDPLEKPSSLFAQLLWLKEAGFGVVDCFWMYAAHAIYGGYKTRQEPPPEADRLTYDEARAIAEDVLM